MEAVVLDEGGKATSSLCRRWWERDATAPVLWLLLFDLLYIDDADLIQEPLYMGDEKGLLEIIQTGALNFIQGERL